MRPSISVTQTLNMAAEVRKAMASLTKNDVYIGIPAEQAGRDAVGINNASLGYIHEHGSPAAGIPARPHLIPGIQDIVPEAVELLKDAAQRALEGNAGAVDATLNKIGILGQNAVRNRFVNNDWAPLADSTLDYQPLQKDDGGNVMADKQGNPKRKKSRRERGRVNPLIYTSQLRKSYTYVVRQRAGKLITGGSQ